MKNYLYGIFAFTILAFTACSTDELPDPNKPKPDTEEPGETLAGELMVKFAPYVGEILEQTMAKTRAGEATRSGILSVDEVLDIVGGYQLERVFPVDPRTEERTRQSELHLWYVVRYSEAYTAEEVAEKLSQLGEVQNINLNRTIKRAYNTDRKPTPLTREMLQAMRRTTRAEASTSTFPFNDELLPKQWHLINRGDMFQQETPKSIVGADVRCEEAWKLTTGDPSIIVAVLDEGVKYDHPDLMNNMWHNEDETFRSRKDNDGNGYAGDYYGYNFVQNTGVIFYDDLYDVGHGSHVAGTIAAQNDNGIGVSSIAGGSQNKPGVKIMSCQIFSGNTVSNALATIKAIKYATDNGAVILQCSWGYNSGSANSALYQPGFVSEEEWAKACPLEKAALDYFVHNAGSPNGPIEGGIAIFAGGNEYAPKAGFPGGAEMCISVSATAADFTPSTYTNFGPGINIAAPGGDQDYYYEYKFSDSKFTYGTEGCVVSTLPYHISDTGYGYMEGTSMACPHVSGVVALGLSYAAQLRRHFTVEEFKQLLFETTTPIDDYMTGLKTYSPKINLVGPGYLSQLNKGQYKGRMGVGQVNAIKFLNAIAGNGKPISFPNLYVPFEKEITVLPGSYFVDGENLTYTVAVTDQTVATATIEGNKLTVKGDKIGVTKATITASNGTANSFNITVRKSANGNGWL